MLQALSICGSRVQHEEEFVCRVTDIGKVAEDKQVCDSEMIDCIYEADIVGVKQLWRFSACVCCRGRVEPLTPPGGQCSRSECGMFQHIDRCSTQVSALFSFQYGEQKESGVHKFVGLWCYGRKAVFN